MSYKNKEQVTVKVSAAADERVAKLYRKTLGVFKSKNFHFDPINMQASSYGWWPMVTKIKNVVVYNSNNYSQSTTKHQIKLRRVMNALNIRPTLTVNVRSNLNNKDSVVSEIVFDLAELKVKLKHSSQKACQASYKKKIKDLNTQLSTLKKLGFPVSAEKIAAAETQASLEREARLARKREERAAKKESSSF